MFSLRDLISAVPCQFLTAEAKDVTFSSASIDSRSIQRGQLFFAIRGKNQDGHAFVDDAFRAGAVGAVISKQLEISDGCQLTVLVPDTLEALKKLSHIVRCKRNPILVGVTGSAGKTTTKEMLAHVLNTRYSVQKSQASFNNQYGVPLTLLQLQEGCTHLVVEIGANHHGEIDELARIAEPDIGILTNIGYAHIENFGSLEGTLKTKTELIDNVRRNGVIIINFDDPLLRAEAARWKARPQRLLSVGRSVENDIYITDLSFSGESISGRLHYNGKSVPLRLNLVGEHFVTAALLATAAAVACGLELDVVVDALVSFAPPAGRLNVKSLTATLWVIDDTYNASPDAMRMALRTLKNFQIPRRIAVLGEMRELGSFTQSCHEMIGIEAAAAATHLIVVGQSSEFIRQAACQSGLKEDRTFVTNSATEALAVVQNIVDSSAEKTVVLAKGSRFTHMERVVLGLDRVRVGCRLGSCSKYIHCKICPLLEEQCQTLVNS
jgi:UDP-N-acetylmuramoyl-tripeptide--D-alanyl-D-alanine ligase